MFRFRKPEIENFRADYAKRADCASWLNRRSLSGSREKAAGKTLIATSRPSRVSRAVHLTHAASA